MKPRQVIDHELILAAVRRKSETGKTNQQIADDFGVSLSAVSHIVARYANRGAFKENYLKNKDAEWIAWFTDEWTRTTAQIIKSQKEIGK